MARHDRSRPGLVAALLLLFCAGCGDRSAHAVGPIYSPNGEMLNGGPLGHPSCEVAMSQWFARADTDHDGALELNEFIADTRRQFAVMDLDKDGYITPAELADYRGPFVYPEARAAAADGGETARQDRGGGFSLFGFGGGRENTSNEPSDPVMSADVNMRNRVSLADFIAYARKEFGSLDAKHDGHVTLSEVQDLCTAQPRR